MYGHDSLRRLTTVSGTPNAKRYLYRNRDEDTSTAQVGSLSYPELTGSPAFQYTYDANGNIQTYAAPGSAVVTYTYDNQGQLLTATDGTDTYSYTYDNAGNILTASNTASTHTYIYGNANWKGLLTAFDGQTISYDGSGNPTSYYNGTRWTFQWENGRELATATDGTTSITYDYDANGLRTTKTVDGVTHTYYYGNDGKLLRETYGDTILDFFYNPDGTAHSLKHNGTTYYYVTNLQGDVIQIVNADGTVVGGYAYDPYGRIIDTTYDGTLGEQIANINPLRYRGYYYDTETGMYYLQSRYYDPVVGRFINADEYTSTGQGIIGNNMFAYCNNNPIARLDSDGEAFETVFDVVSLGFSIAEVAANPYDPMAWIGLAGDVVDIIPFVTGVGETIRGIRFIDKAGNTLEIARATDFTDDAIKAMGKLDNVNGFTKSDRFLGRDIHKGYKKGPGFSTRYKEFNEVDGIRPDYYDEGKSFIFELKPFNPASAKAGVRQLKKYNSKLGGNNRMRLEFY